MKIQLITMALALCVFTCFAETNLLPLNNGLPELKPAYKTKCSIEAVDSVEQKRILKVTSTDTDVKLETAQVKPAEDGYIICEITARSTADDTPLTVIAIGYQYKAIAERHYRLSTSWGKYAAAIKCDMTQPKQTFMGRFDFPKGHTVEIAEVRVYSVGKLDELSKDLAYTIYGESAFPVEYLINDKVAAGENMLPADGYFGPELPMHLKSVKPLDPGDKISFEKCDYEKSDYVLEVRHGSKTRKPVQLSTAKMPITNNLMVIEVMARSTGKGIANPRFAVVAIASNYKYITHKHFNLTNDWRKYVAVVEIPSAPENKNIFWGRVDVPSGVQVQIGRISVYSLANNTKIAGMADDAETESKKKSTEPTLIESPTPIPTAEKLISSQLGNTNPIRKIKPRLSTEIPAGNIAGAALCNSSSAECAEEGESYGAWSPWWVIADPSTRSAVVNPCFSSAMRSSGTGGDTLTVWWKKPVRISRIVLVPRDGKLTGFPLDWHVEISADGETFHEVYRTKDYDQLDMTAQISFPEQEVSAIRVTADKIRPEGKDCGYFQLKRLEALTADGQNLALPRFGASAETNNPLNMPLLSHQLYYDTLVRCGIKTVLIDINARPKDPLSIYDGIALNSPGYRNLTSLIKFLKENGVDTIIRLGYHDLYKRLFSPEHIREMPRIFTERYLPHVRSWKGLVSAYSLAGEENQFRKGGSMKYSLEEYIRCYSDSCRLCAEEIRKIDPSVQISVATALFDFGWTETTLKNGLGKPGVVDTFSVHIYRENDPLGSYPEKCYSFFVDGRRGLETERMFTRAEDEIKAYRELLSKYNSELKMSCNETCIKTGDLCRGMASTETGQAKYVGRQYVMHQFYGIGPTVWWAFLGTREKDRGLLWGMVDISNGGRKVRAWHSYSYFNALFDNSWKPDKEFGLVCTPADDRIYSYTFKRGEEWMAAAWISVSMRDGNTGKETDILIPGSFAPDTEVECIDLLNGGIQKMNTVRTEEGLLLKGIILRDYVLVFRPVKQRDTSGSRTE